MAVRDRFVPVAVRVPERARLARMRVVMVAVVVAGGVLVLLCRVRVGVGVPVAAWENGPRTAQKPRWGGAGRPPPNKATPPPKRSPAARGAPPSASPSHSIASSAPKNGALANTL